MSSILIAIPVIKDSRKFHLEKGRRWTVIEHLLLEALAKRDWSIGDLATATCLPRRVVIEIVIRLMRAGWVELRSGLASVIFTSTATGRAYALRDDLPPVTRATSRYVGYAVELFSGTVFRARDLVTLNTEQWNLRRAGHLSNEVAPRLDHREALPDVQLLADRLLESDEHLTRVDVQDWRPRRLLAVVTVKDGEIEGIGGDIPEHLRSEILRTAELSQKPGSATTSVPPTRLDGRTRTPRRAHPIVFRPDDLVMGGDQHRSAFRSAMLKANHRVIIHSTFISEERAFDAFPLLKGPVQRGAIVDILWGQSREKNDINETRQAAIALKEKVAQEGLQDRIRVHMTSTRSHAKILLYDVGDPHHMRAVIGSCNWLSSDFGSFDVSVLVREPGVLADIAFDIAELARPRDGQIPDLSIEMLRLGRRQQSLGLPATSRGRATIITAPEHAAVIASARECAQQRILLLSHRLDVAARPTLHAIAAATQNGGTSKLDARYGRIGDTVASKEAKKFEDWAKSEGVDLRLSKIKLHAKTLAWDRDSVLITSQNLLSADPGSGSPRQELGVLVQAPDAATILMAAFDSAESENQKGKK